MMALRSAASIGAIREEADRSLAAIASAGALLAPLELAFAGHPPERPLDRLKCCIDILFGVGGGEETASMEEVDPFQQHAKMKLVNQRR